MIRLNVFIRTTESNREELVRTASDVLMICETWSNAKALAAHEQASHFTTLVPRLEQLGELKIEKFVF